MKKKFPVIVGLFIILFFFQACTKGDLQTFDFEARDKEQFTEVAKYFSQANTAKEIRQQIIQTVKNEGIEEFALYRFNNQVNLDSISMLNPMITIAYPSLAFHEGESLEQHLQQIDYIVLLYDLDPDEEKTLTALTPSGQSVTISSIFDETKRYCVIKYSEELIAVNAVTNKTYYGSNVPINLSMFTPTVTIGDYKMYKNEDFLNAAYQSGQVLSGLITSPPVDPPITWPPVSPPSGCDRDVLRKDELHKIKFSGLDCIRNYESGFHLPTLELVVAYAIPRYNGGSVAVDLVFKDVRIHWKHCSTHYSDPLALDIVTWNKTLYGYGDTWQVLWIERDYWDAVSGEFTLGFNVSFKLPGDNTLGVNVGYKVTRQKKDKQLGTSLIEYCDAAHNEGVEYKVASCNESGGFWFKEHIRGE